ncbi:MAG: hypothetical protein C4560_09790 [Nitrospiraceae bacterium]|nr:MAG: hypothetical protein C4560_09790 [Nitrospiraceae bacterium]
MNEQKVFILGLDGATFDIINKMLEQGELPNFRKVMKKGSHCALNSTFLHHSPPAWTSFSTGRDPGKHGILGFIQMANNAYGLQLVNGIDNRSSTMWEELTNEGRKVIVMNIPMTYPPKPVNGILISGLDTPSLDVDFTYPKNIKQEVLQNAPNYQINLHLGGYLYNDKRKMKGLNIIHENIESQRKTVLYLMEKYPWDMFAVRFNSPDNVQHQYWAYMDEKHPEYNPRADRKLKDAIFGVYRKLDEVVGEIYSRLESANINLIIMSDHGAGPRVGKSIFVNEWLKDMGLLSQIGKENKSSFRRLLDDTKFFVKGKILSFFLKSIPPHIKAKLTELVPWAAAKTANYLRFSGLDWANTRAFMGEVEGIRINLKGKYPQGIVAEEEYEKLRDKIISKAKMLKDPETGNNAFKGVYRREEVFKGDCTVNFPDIVLKPNDLYYLSPKFFRRNEKKPGVYLANDTHWRKISGSHSQHGIFIITGPDVKPDNQIDAADIIDIFPTAFYLMGVPVSDDVDGKVLYKCFNENFVDSRKVKFKKSDTKTKSDGSDIYSKEEQDELMKSLKGLGYIG